ncbi:MAG: AAA domain-containing protein [Pelistega sp.]|nr:AAA domain-containing protein [Pelistega sp.]
MEVIDWGGGLTLHELDAIEKIKQAFSSSNSEQKIVKGDGLSALKSLKSIFPWRGYSGFRLSDVRERKDGEFDLVIITHCNVLIVELKHWNGGIIKSSKDRWSLNGQDRGRSPVSITRSKQYLLEKKLDKFKQEFTNKNYRPQVHFLVVMTGNADFSELDENEKLYVLNLSDFLELKEEHRFNQRFRPHPNSKSLNQDFEIFDKKIFGIDTVKPKSISIGGYYAEDAPIFEHPNNIYREYFAQSEYKKHRDVALLRRWDFTKIQRPEVQTPDGRFRLISREYDILQYIKLHNAELYHTCLKYKNTPQKGEVTAEHIDIFELFPQQKRFNQFVGGHSVQNLNIERRFDLVKLLLDKFVQLHQINIAHRDLGEHSIWLSVDDKIMLSGFATAYLSSEQTVGDVRDILAVSGDLAKINFPLSDRVNLTVYQSDVRTLAVLIWHIIHAERVSPDSLQKMQSNLEVNTEWYVNILRTALSDKPFQNAQEFLERFNQKKPEQTLDFSFEFSKLEPFYHDISHSRAYREDDGFIKETAEKEVYLSNGALVKAWLRADPHKDRHEARIVFNWLGSIAKLAQLSPDYLPKIRSFGIARKSSSLFIVSDFIENGYTWSQVAELDGLTDEKKIALINMLLHNIEHLHGLGFTHGDLKPDNILVTMYNDEFRLYLLDIFDFSINGKKQFNTEYAPAFDNATEMQCDNFAVMKMACELLNITWNMPSEKFSDISDVIQLENQDLQSNFISLDRFKEALNPKQIIPSIEVLIGGRNTFNPIEIYPENDELFVKFERGTSDNVLVSFIGLGGILKVLYSVRENKFTYAQTPIERDYITKLDKDNSELSLAISLKVSYHFASGFDKLNEKLSENKLFKQAINGFIREHIFKHPEPKTLGKIESNTGFGVGAVLISDEVEIMLQRPKTKDLWEAILNTETEALPAITASAGLQKLETGEIYIPYDGDIDPLDQFNRDEIVEALGFDDKNEKTFKYGTVDLIKSCLNELHLKSRKLNYSSEKIEFDTPIYLQSIQNKASYQRRKSALQRILDNESVIKNLVQYFDEDCTQAPNNYGIFVSDEQFARYDRIGLHGETISLNEAQRQAFQVLISNGPLSLLQGPPGTGKTEFIAAFVHYLFDQQNVNSILLVSQSHEAVNTAAERVRKHSMRLGTNLQIVRFSNREIADSEELEDVFSQNLVGQKRQQLAVNKIINICQLGRAMGLPEEYLRERAKMQFDIGVQIRRYLKLVKSPPIGSQIDEDEKRLVKSIEKVIRNRAEQLGLTNVEVLEVGQISLKLVAKLDHKYNIQPAESLQAGKLIDLTRDMLEALSNNRTNYDEFLARSRQLVVGTCVGIGQKHIGIADNIYDWVIVDEAARSISSELAIAMQSGKRILLVGDQKQLPPLYSTEHKNALARRLGISKRGDELDQALGSDFERVFQSEYGKQTCATLKVQYRMAPAIGSLISTCFYDGVLENGKTESDVPDIYSGLPDNFKSSVTWLDTTKLSNSYHIQNKNSFFNRAEADVILELLQDLANDETIMTSEMVQRCLQSNTPAIGVICMYAEQKKLIRKKFNEKTWDDAFRRLVKIDSVDSYQGKENRIIILSLSRHDKEFSTGFLYLPNRINVALSRAMDKLIIVGAATVWEQPQNSKMPLGRVLKFIQQRLGDHKYALKTMRQKGMN